MWPGLCVEVWERGGVGMWLGLYVGRGSLWVLVAWEWRQLVGAVRGEVGGWWVLGVGVFRVVLVVPVIDGVAETNTLPQDAKDVLRKAVKSRAFSDLA